MSSTLINMGVPLGSGTGRGNIIQPKTAQKFRVRVTQFGPTTGGITFTQQVMKVGRPSFQQDAKDVHSYNSIAYYAGKAVWQPISLTLRDDVTNAASALVGAQVQKQMNFFQQTTAEAGSNYKFQMYIETMDGGNDAVLEQWLVEGCFLESVNWEAFDYSSSEAMTIEMSIRYDVATQQGGLMPISPDIGTGTMIS